MRIGIDVFPLSPHYRAAGIPRAVRETLRELQSLDQENDYDLYSKLDFEFRFENPRWHKRLHLAIPYLVGSLSLRLKDVMTRQGDAGLDVFWTTRTQRFPIGLPSNVARVLSVYDLVWLVHPETMEEADRSAFRRFAHRGLRQAHKIIAISESTRRGLIERTGTPAEKIEVVHLAVNGTFTRRDRGESARFIAQKYSVSSAYICTVGTLEPRKNMITLMQAVRMLRDRGPLRHQLLIAGAPAWGESDIRAAVERCGLTEKEVKFLGWIPEKDLPLLYSGAALFVFPSLYEGFGLPLVEAMASGTPIVASNTSSIPEVTEDAAVLVSPWDPAAFADAIAKVTDDAGLGRALAEKGLRRAREFTWQAAAVKTRRVLEQAAQVVRRVPSGLPPGTPS